MADSEFAIRDACEGDAPSLEKIYAFYVENTAVTFDVETRSQDAFAELIRTTQLSYPFLVAVCGDRVAGYAYASRFRRQAAYDACVELSIYLDPAYRGRGIGRALYEELERRLKAQGIANLYACVSYPIEADEYLDMASIRFHERRGFAIIGRFHACGRKFGRIYDMVWMEKLIG